MVILNQFQSIPLAGGVGFIDVASRGIAPACRKRIECYGFVSLRILI